MGVVSSTQEITPQRWGVKARFRYTFGDGRVVERGLFRLQDEAAATARRLELVPVVEAEIAKQDAAAAYEEGSTSPRGEADQDSVDREWIRQAVLADEHYVSYEKLSPYFAQINASTDAQIANKLGTTEGQAAKLRSYCTWLFNNQTIIQDYTALVNAMEKPDVG